MAEERSAGREKFCWLRGAVQSRATDEERDIKREIQRAMKKEISREKYEERSAKGKMQRHGKHNSGSSKSRGKRDRKLEIEVHRDKLHLPEFREVEKRKKETGNRRKPEECGKWKQKETVSRNYWHLQETAGAKRRTRTNTHAHNR